MAKQIAGLCRLEGTFDDLTFYKMDGEYYARAKSSLSSKRVKTSPEFKWTMIYARLLARASKIGSQVYKALPPGWRQFWMYRGFTGEAFTLLKESSYTDAEVKQLLWKCYVEYWEQMKVADPDNVIWQPKPEKIRKRRVYSLESLLRQKDKNGKPKWRNLEEEERKRLALEKKREWCRRQEKGNEALRQQQGNEAPRQQGKEGEGKQEGNKALRQRGNEEYTGQRPGNRTARLQVSQSEEAECQSGASSAGGSAGKFKENFGFFTLRQVPLDGFDRLSLTFVSKDAVRQAQRDKESISSHWLVAADGSIHKILKQKHRASCLYSILPDSGDSS